MAHEISSKDRFGEVRVNGQRAWHGLGVEIEDGLSAEEGFKRVGLGWSTELAPMFAVVGEGKDQKRIALPDDYCHVRSDNLDVLGLVKGDYKAFENMDLARFADALAGADAAVTCETAGSLYGGKRVFALVRLPKVIQAAKGDELHQYVAVTNGHGGFAAFATYPTSVRIVCANTLRWSERDVSRGLRIRHTGKLEEKIAQARLALGIALEETEKFEQQVKALVRTNLSVAKARNLMKRTWESCFGKIDEKGEPEDVAKMTEKRDNMVEHWIELMEKESAKIPSIAGSAWVAYNAVSFWNDHERGRFKDVDESDARVHSNVFGISQAHKLKAFQGALQLVT